MRLKMNYALSTLSVAVLVAAFSGCNSSAGSQAAAARHAHPVAGPTPGDEHPRRLNDIFVDEGRLSYGGYDVLRLKKKVIIESPGEKGEAESAPVEVSYAVLKRGKQTLAAFDGVYHGLGNATDFGLFPLLGGSTQQLIVSQTVPRGGRHWVVGLSPDFRVLFDSGDYGVGREEFAVIDVDKDGRYEISLPVTAFYSMQGVMYIAEIPLPEIVFKYDERAEKYLPANTVFQEYALRGIEEDVKRLSSDEKSNYLSKRLDIFLRYIYAGQKDEAWDFFDREYRLPDKEEVRSKVEAVLQDEAVYRYIYRDRAS